jgi:hypothetical protein
MPSKLLSRREHLGCRLACVAGRLTNLSNAARDDLCAVGRFLDIAGDLGGGRALLFHRGRDRHRDLGHLADGAGNRLNGLYGLGCHLLDAGDLRRDFVGRPRGRLASSFTSEATTNVTLL